MILGFSWKGNIPILVDQIFYESGHALNSSPVYSWYYNSFEHIH